VLDLDARVHLEEEVLAVAREQALDRAGALVADRARGVDGDRADALAQARRRLPGDGVSSTSFWWRRWIVQSRSPRWMTLPLRVREHLHLDVRGILEVALDVRPPLSEKYASPSRCADSSARASLVGDCGTTFRPLPPPPAEPLIAIGQPSSSPSDAPRRPTSTAAVTPGTIGTRLLPAFRSRASIFEPIASIASGGGRSRRSPAVDARPVANAAFSARKP
jgi:hypothetical protein